MPDLIVIAEESLSSLMQQLEKKSLKEREKMKTGIHPDYRDVVFHDTSVDEYFVIGSTLKTGETIDWKDGNTYPYYPIDTSSSSHPFYTGKQQIAQAEGRVANFNRRFGHLSKK